tara:strand:+ start:940 stop:1821 length:882 start_codon:yes stop_codon:yes gene_type:complete
MKSSKYKIDGPALISFSGGRTSGYMLYQILKAHGGELPSDLYVTFANTGKEMPETLDFVRDCGEHWGVKIHWLEMRIFDERPIYRTEEVTYETAARNGEPFAALIDHKHMLPNPLVRFCTEQLKIMPMKRFMKERGYKEWYNVVGLRYDEPRRVGKQKAANENNVNPWESLTPLYEEKVVVQDIFKFWEASNFDLNLPNHGGKTLAGNCDLCFLKGMKTTTMILKERPDLANWWIEQEAKLKESSIKVLGRVASTTRFRKDRPPYIELVDISKKPEPILDMFGDEGMDCFCHD